MKLTFNENKFLKLLGKDRLEFIVVEGKKNQSTGKYIVTALKAFEVSEQVYKSLGFKLTKMKHRSGLKMTIKELANQMNKKFEKIDQRFEFMNKDFNDKFLKIISTMDARFENVDNRLDKMSEQIHENSVNIKKMMNTPTMKKELGK